MRNICTNKGLKTFVLVSSFLFFSCSNMVEDLRNLGKKQPEGPGSDSVPETVTEIWLEKIETDDFEKALEVPAEGFEFSETKSENDSSGKIIKKDYYKRVRVTLTFKLDGGLWDASDAESTGDKKITDCKYGAQIPNPPFSGVPIKPRFGFTEWKNDDGKILGAEDGIKTVPAKDMTFTAQWSDAYRDYKVKFLFESLNDSSIYEERTEAQIITCSGDKTGVTVTNTWTFQGFTATDTEKQTGPLNDDGNTVVEFKYSRNDVTLTFKLQNTTDGSWTDNSTADKSITKKFESPLTAIDVPTAVGSGNFVWDSVNKWNPAMPTIFPAENTTYTAQWKQVKADYKLRYLFEDLNSNPKTYSVRSGNEDEVKNAVLEGEAVSYKTILGFEPAESITETGALNPDGSTVIELKYNRKTVSLSFGGNGGKWSDGQTSKTVQGKFEESTYGKLPVNPSYDDLHDFSGWNPTVPSTFPATDASYTAQWTEKDSSSVSGEAIYTNSDITVSQDISVPNKLTIKVTHVLNDLTFTFVALANKVLHDLTITKNSIGNTTTYQFTVDFTKPSGTYALQLLMNNGSVSYSVQCQVTK